MIVNKPSNKIHKQVVLGIFNEKITGSKIGTLNVIELPLFDYPEIKEFVDDRGIHSDCRNVIKVAWDSFITCCYDRQWNPKHVISFYFPDENDMDEYCTYICKLFKFKLNVCLFVSSLQRLNMFVHPY